MTTKQHKAWAKKRSSLAFLDEELDVLCRYKEVSGGVTTMRQLPKEAYKLVMQYLPIYNTEWKGLLQLAFEVFVTSPEDAEAYASGADRMGVIKEVEASLEDHKQRFGMYAVYLSSVGLPIDTRIEEREEIRSMLQKTVQRATRQINRWELIGRWSNFHHTTMHTTCYELARTLPKQLNVISEKVGKFIEDWPNDPVATTITSELAFISSRLLLIENLGAETVTKADCKHMFLSLNLPFDNSVSDDYPKCITFRQAVTLGLFTTSRLRGFIWEDKMPCYEDKDEELARFVRKAGERDALRKAQKKLRTEKKNERVAEAKRVLSEGKAAAANQMGLRLWMAADRETFSYDHHWAGCELCGDPHVSWVAVPLSQNSTPPVVLCTTCSPEYSSRRVVHRSYIWLWISYLTDLTIFDEVPSVARLALAMSTYRDPHIPGPPQTTLNDELIQQAEREKTADEEEEREEQERQKRDEAEFGCIKQMENDDIAASFW